MTTPKKPEALGTPYLAGFKDLHSFAFLGGSGRIGAASDYVFTYPPAGPHQQLDLFLRAYDLCKAGRAEVCLLQQDMRQCRHRALHPGQLCLLVGQQRCCPCTMTARHAAHRLHALVQELQAALEPTPLNDVLTTRGFPGVRHVWDSAPLRYSIMPPGAEAGALHPLAVMHGLTHASLVWQLNSIVCHARWCRRAAGRITE